MTRYGRCNTRLRQSCRSRPRCHHRATPRSEGRMKGGAVVWCVLNLLLDYALLSRERVKRTQESTTIKWLRVWCVWRGVNATRVPLQCDCAVLCPSPLLPSRGGPYDRTLNRMHSIFCGAFSVETLARLSDTGHTHSNILLPSSWPS